ERPVAAAGFFDLVIDLQTAGEIVTTDEVSVFVFQPKLRDHIVAFEPNTDAVFRLNLVSRDDAEVLDVIDLLTAEETILAIPGNVLPFRVQYLDVEVTGGQGCTVDVCGVRP